MKTQPQLLTDARFIQLSLMEGKSPSGNVRVRGEFARAGIATENKRVYPKQIWEKEIGRLGKAMQGRSVYGEADHPKDGRTSLGKVSHIVTDLRLEDGILVGEAEILPTDAGRNLSVLLQSNCKVGISSRGFGSTKSGDNGEDIVQEDYKLVTFDFVADPADQNAYPSIVGESKDLFFEGMDIGAMLPKQEDLKSKEWAKKLVAETAEKPEQDKAQLADAMLSAVASLKSEISDQIRNELLADPSVAGAKTALEAVVGILRPFVLPEDAESVVRSKETEISRLKRVIAERDLKVTDLEKENQALAEAAKRTGYSLYLERSLRDDPDAEFIIKMVGDVQQYENAEALKTRIQAIKEEALKARAEEEAAEKLKSEEINRAHGMLKEIAEKYEADIAKRDKAIEGLTEATKKMAMQLYAEKKLRIHPKSAKIRPLIDSMKVSSKTDIDAIFESHRASAPKDEDDASELRSRIRRLTKGGIETDIDAEEGPRRLRNENKNSSDGMDLLSADLKELGLNLHELTQL